MDPRNASSASHTHDRSTDGKSSGHTAIHTAILSPLATGGAAFGPTVGLGALSVLSLLLAIILAPRHTVMAQESEGGVIGVGCKQIEVTNVRGTCPPIQGPQRDDPWLPTVLLPSPDEDLGADCNAISVTISHIRLLDCTTNTSPYDQPLMRFDAGGDSVLHVPPPVPDYSGEFDAIPIKLCLLRSEVPDILYIRHPEHSRRVGSGRATVYCCESCS